MSQKELGKYILETCTAWNGSWSKMVGLVWFDYSGCMIHQCCIVQLRL